MFSNSDYGICVYEFIRQSRWILSFNNCQSSVFQMLYCFIVYNEYMMCSSNDTSQISIFLPHRRFKSIKYRKQAIPLHCALRR